MCRPGCDSGRNDIVHDSRSWANRNNFIAALRRRKKPCHCDPAQPNEIQPAEQGVYECRATRSPTICRVECKLGELRYSDMLRISLLHCDNRARGRSSDDA